MATKAKDAHNDRRRANRAIRRNAAEWARRQGFDPAFADAIERNPPIQAKEWLKAIGKNPNDFKDEVPVGGLPSGINPQPGSTPAWVPPSPAVPPPAAGPAPRIRARGAAGAVRGPIVAPPMPPQQGGATWSQESWCTPELKSQIDAVMAAQGTDRDERSMLAGTSLASRRAHGGTNETSRVGLDNGMVGYHKPFDGLKDRLASSFGQNSAQQPVHEAAAWRLASQMGPPWSEMVPPVVIREVGGRLGSFAVERPGMPARGGPWQVPEWREAGFFDSLIGQQDRHSSNYLIAGDRMALIDHGYAFARPGDYLNHSQLATKREVIDPVLTHNERAVLDRLLASPDLMGMSSMLEPERASALRSRAERMKASNRILPLRDF